MLNFKSFSSILESKISKVNNNIRTKYIPKKDLLAVEIANKTSRKSGAIGDNAIVPRYMTDHANIGEKILDFGSGKDATHAKKLRKLGYDVTAHEFGNNVNDNHDKLATTKKYDTTYASNVLNTQSSPRMLDRTINSIHKVTKNKLVANLPLNPRKSKYLTPSNVKTHINRFFKNIEEPKIVDGSEMHKSKPLYVATEPKPKIRGRLNK
jgi:hypothetical protein